ncbi:MAG: O-antigen ligase family protein [Flavobacteriaceae bacterium]
MAFRILLVFFFALVTINLEIVPGVAKANPIEKGLLLVCGLAFLATRRINGVNLLLLGLLGFATFVAAAATGYSGFETGRYLRGLVSLVVPWLFLAAEPTTRDRDLLIRIFSWLPLCIIGLGAIYSAAGLHPLWHTDFLGAPRLQGSTIPAGLGSVCFVGTFAAMLGAALNGGRLHFGLAALNFVILILSAARMSLALSLVLCATVYLTMMRKNPVSLLAMAVAGPVVAIGMLFTIGQPLLTRFESQSTSGRDLIWDYLAAWLDKFPAFGVGLGHQIVLLPEDIMQKTGTIAAHNEYLRLAVETGYFGVTAIFGCLALMCLNIWCSPRVAYRPVFLVACLTFFVYCWTDNAISSTNIPFVLVLASFAFARREGAAAIPSPVPAAAVAHRGWKHEGA